MADQRVVITLNVNSRGGAQITALQKQLAALDRQNNKLLKTTRMADEYFFKLANKTDMVSRTFVKMRSIVGTMIGIFAKFNAVLSALAIVTLPLLNATFAAGRLIMKAYNATLQLVAVGIAAVGAAIAVGLAAFKEYNAAMQSFAYTTTGTVNPTQRASGAIRNLQRDAKLAVFGITGLNDAFVQVNQSSTFTGESQKMLRALSDFAAAGGDPAKNIAAAGAFIGLLQKEGKLTQEVLQAGEKIGPQFAKALTEAKKKGMSSAEDLKRMLYEGDLAAYGGVVGQASRLNNTMVAQFKRILSESLVIGTDIGDAILGPAKKALQEIGSSITRTLRRLAPMFVTFGRGTFLDGLVGGFIKLEDVLVRFLRKWLPASVGILGKFVNWWQKVVYVFKNLRERMQPLLDAGRAIMDVFGPAFTQIFTRFGGEYHNIGKLMADNREEFDRLGVNLERFVNLFFDFGATLGLAFSKALPIINSVAEAFMRVAETLLAIIRGLATLGSGGLGGFGAGLGGMAALYMMFSGKRMLGGGAGPGSPRGLGALKNDKVRFAKGVFGGVPGGGRGGGGGGGGQGPASKIGGFNASLKQFGILPGGAGAAGNFFPAVGYGRPALPPVPITPMPQMMGLLAQMQMQQNNFDPDLKKATLREKYRMLRSGAPATPGLGRSGAAGRALGMSIGQKRYRQGFAPSGMGAGVAGMLASQFAMGNMDFADTGLGGAGKTLSSTGSMLAMFNPMMGLGLTLGGGALGAKTAEGGALAGAGAGAALGAMVGPVGAAVGAMLGGIVGAVSGSIHRFKAESKKLKSAAQQRGLEVFGQIAQGFVAGGDFSKAKGQSDQLRQEADKIRNLGLDGLSRMERNVKITELRKAGQITKEQYDLLSNGVKDYVDGLDNQADNIDKVTNVIETGFNKKMSAMISITGKSQEEIVGLANEIGVNLFDATMSTTDALGKMGLTMMHTAEQVRGAIVDIQQNALSPLRKEIAIMDTNRQIEQLVQGLSDMGAAAEKQDVYNFGADLVDLMNLKFPEDPYGNILRATDEIVRESRPGGRLAGIGQNLILGLLSSLEGAKVTQKADTSDYLATELAKGFATQGRIISQEDIAAQIAKMSDADISKLSGAVADKSIFGAFSATSEFGAIGGPTSGVADIGGVLEGILFKTLGPGAADPTIFFDKQQNAMYEGVMAGVTAAFKDSPGWWTEYPAWWGSAPGGGFPGSDGDPNTPFDTSTPKVKQIGDTATSKIMKTLGKHRMMDASIPGKRKVTSSLRNYNLGSLNSDHVTGNAYDLTGQNLGDYAYTVKANGGLAEFHGWGSSRHLHVVPGMDPEGQWFGGYKWGRELAGTTGDSPTPAMPKMMPPASASGGTYNYSVVVNGASADPNQIADAVINKIQRMERDKKERR
jgi:hypothetical protein